MFWVGTQASRRWKPSMGSFRAAFTVCRMVAGDLELQMQGVVSPGILDSAGEVCFENSCSLGL